MAQYKVTLFFDGDFSPPTGFSESWEFDRTDDAAAKSAALALVDPRRAVLAQNWSIRTVRLAKLLVIGSGPTCRLKQEAVSVEGCISAGAGLLGGTDTPWTAIYIEMPTRQSTPSVGLPPRPRRYQMRGIPDTWWDGTNAELSDEAGPLIATWMSHVINVLQAGDAKPNSGCTAVRIQPYTTHCVRRISSRRIGRPFGLVRGRRSAQAAAPAPT